MHTLHIACQIPMQSQQLSISLLRSASTSSAERLDLSTQDLLSALATPEAYEVRPDKNGGAWSPIVWSEGRRSSASAESISCLVYDLDDPTADLGALGARIDSTEWIHAIHETYTSGRFRLVFPLSRDLRPSEYAGAWGELCRRLEIPADPTGKDLARLFYLPSKPTSDSERLCGFGGSKLLDPSEISGLRELSVSSGIANSTKLVESKIPQENTLENFSVSNEGPIDLSSLRSAIRQSSLAADLKRELTELVDMRLILKKGERENKLHRLTCGMVSALPDNWEKDRAESAIEMLFTPLVERMEKDPTEDNEYFLSRVGSSFDRSWEHKQGRLKKRKLAKEAAEKFLAPDTWRGKLLQNESKQGPRVRPCTSNIDLILENDPGFKGHIKFDDLHRSLAITGGELGDSNLSTVGLQLSNWLQTSEYQIDVGHPTCGQCLLLSARRHAFSPVSDYLEGLVWDGVPRIHEVLTKHCGAEGNLKYIQDISKKFFISAAARGLEPGCKVDTVLVLQGPQGIRKTSFVETLAGDWYTTVSGRTDDKDTRIQATSAWFVELSELASLGKSSIESLRGFLTQRVDHIRLPYAAAHEEFQRRCIFVGTTNSEQPLIDQEGNRRFWVIPVTRVDIAAIEKEREQLWAEAVWCFRQWQEEKAEGLQEGQMRYRWWLTAEEQEVSNEENSVYQTENPMEAEINHWISQQDNLNAVKPMSCTEIAKKILGMTNEMLNRDATLLQKVGKTMKSLKWERSRIVTLQGKRMWVYSPRRP